MKDKERIKKFIELQNKGLKLEDIALELGIAKTTLRVFLNKNGYKMYNGIYKLKDESAEFKQIEFEESKSSNNKSTKITKSKKTSNKEDKTKKEVIKKVDNKTNKQSKSKQSLNTDTIQKKNVKMKSVRKDRKINITQEDLDKLCEVYDWYMEVKDLKTIKSKPKNNKKDIKIENSNIENLKTTSIKVDKSTWEDFERLCSNSQFSKIEIITQALKDFMKEYKNLL